VPSDITPMVEVSQKAGLPIEVYTFIGSSPIRALAEDWDLPVMLKRSADAIDVAVKNGLPCCYVTEDTIRSKPDVLAAMFKNAVDHGATRLCLCDTVGHATPDGVRNLIQFAKSVVAAMGCGHVKIDWHGHNDRGLALANALAAGAAGATRLHGCAAGIGERVGNTACDQLLVNLKLLGHPVYGPRDMSKLCRFVELAAKVTGHTLPVNYPVVGSDAFRTATGVHAAAIIKAQKKGDKELADRIYSGVPAGEFGKSQQIEIGPMSGLSNVKHWLARHEIPADEPLAKAVLQRAKLSNRTLTESEVAQIVRDLRSEARS
jgi:2-isopropylmalate synthase